MLATSAEANGPAVGRFGGEIFPVTTDSVQLTFERVNIHLADTFDTGEVRCSYILMNRASTVQSFSMAFVEDVRPRSHIGPLIVTMEGEEQPVRYERIDIERWAPYLGVSPEAVRSGGYVDSLPVWDVVIPPNDGKWVHIHYPVRWAGDTGNWGFVYYAKSASAWAGPIERAEITINFGEFTSRLFRNAEANGLEVRVQPEGYTWSPWGSLSWYFEDWEPDADFSIGVLDPDRPRH